MVKIITELLSDEIFGQAKLHTGWPQRHNVHADFFSRFANFLHQIFRQVKRLSDDCAALDALPNNFFYIEIKFS